MTLIEKYKLGISNVETTSPFSSYHRLSSPFHASRVEILYGIADVASWLTFFHYDTTSFVDFEIVVVNPLMA